GRRRRRTGGRSAAAAPRATSRKRSQGEGAHQPAAPARAALLALRAGVREMYRAGVSPVRAEDLCAGRAALAVLRHHLPVNRLAVVAGRALEPLVAQLAHQDGVVSVEVLRLLRLGVQGLKELDDGGARQRLPALGLVLQQRGLDGVGPDQAREQLAEQGAV